MKVTRTQDQTDKKDDHEQPKKGQPCIVCSKIKHTPLRNLPCSTVQKHNHPCRQNMQKRKQSSIVYMKNQDVRSNQASRQPDSASSISVHFPSFFSFSFFFSFFFPTPCNTTLCSILSVLLRWNIYTTFTFALQRNMILFCFENPKEYYHISPPASRDNKTGKWRIEKSFRMPSVDLDSRND